MHVGASVQVQFSEPWDLVSAVGSDWFSGTISKIALDHESALIMLESPINYAGEVAALLVAMPRYKEQALTPETESIEPRKVTSWFQAIGTLEVANT